MTGRYSSSSQSRWDIYHTETAMRGGRKGRGGSHEIDVRGDQDHSHQSTSYRQQSTYLTPVGVVREIAVIKYFLEFGPGLRSRRGEIGVCRPDLLEVVAVGHLSAVAVFEVARSLVQPGVDDLPDTIDHEWPGQSRGAVQTACA